MKRIINTLIVTSLLSISLSADEFVNANHYDNEFQKMEKFFNSVMAANLTHAKLANLGYPRVNVQNTKDKYLYEFDLAGVPKENIKLSIDENNVLHLEGTKESKSENKSDKYIKQEIYYGSFSRTIKLPSDINQDKLDTKYNNGILTLSIGKKKLKKTKSKILQIK